MPRLFPSPSIGTAIWALAAFAIAAFLILLWRRGRAPASSWVATSILLLTGLLPVVGYLKSLAPYHLHVVVLGPAGTPVDSAKVWSSTGDSSTKVGDGWQLDISSSARPKDGIVLVWAAVDANDMKHSKSVQLGEDHDATVTFRLTNDRSAKVMGKVTDRDGKGIDGAVVSLSGGGSNSVITQLEGNFALPVNAAPGDDVLLQVSEYNYSLKNVWATAGDEHLNIMLDRK